MGIKAFQEEVLKLKKEKDVCILAHSYQSREITEIADLVGDSFALSAAAAKMPQKTVIMCGVRFMAETVKILSPEKTVYLANPLAGCPMADQMDRDLIRQVRERFPDYTVVCYINTTTELKTVCDVCVTSSSAVRIIEKLPDKNILFIPDKQLGGYVAKRLPEKNFKLLSGGCPTHLRAGRRALEKARALYPDALLLAHPECLPDITEAADYVGSTSGIVAYAKQSGAREFIIGTELSILAHLQYDCPEKRFYPLSIDLVCHNMKITTLTDVRDCLRGTGGERITLDEETRLQAKKCIDRMIALGN